jgi:hypothetical protein
MMPEAADTSAISVCADSNVMNCERVEVNFSSFESEKVMIDGRSFNKRFHREGTSLSIFRVSTIFSPQSIT